MTEVLFYHLQNMSLESVLPPLLEKSLERGWRVVVQSTSQERTDALDAHLWTYRDDSFLPHATWRAGDAQDQPIVLAAEEVVDRFTDRPVWIRGVGLGHLQEQERQPVRRHLRPPRLTRRPRCPRSLHLRIHRASRGTVPNRR